MISLQKPWDYSPGDGSSYICHYTPLQWERWVWNQVCLSAKYSGYVSDFCLEEWRGAAEKCGWKLFLDKCGKDGHIDRVMQRNGE
jgi:hypothetical protein